MGRDHPKDLTRTQRLAQDASDWLLGRVEEWSRTGKYGRVRVEVLFKAGKVDRMNLAQDESLDGVG